MQQFLFEGFEETKRQDGLFFALVPDAASAARIAVIGRALKQRHGLSGKLINADRLHVTLDYLGNYHGLPRDLVAAVGQAGDFVAAASFDIAFDRAASFVGKPAKRPFVLLGDEGTAGIAAFQQTLRAAMTEVGLARRSKSYTPHMTLLYDDQLVAEQAITPIGWRAKEFALVHSLRGQGRHIVLTRWPLQG